jgi:hypothetical protein
MKPSRYKELQSRLESFHEAYTLHCAGRMRATRDVCMLEQWLEGLERMRREIESYGALEELQPLLQQLLEKHALYAQEKTAVQQEQARLGEEGRFLWVCYEEALWVFQGYVLRQKVYGHVRAAVVERTLGRIKQLLQQVLAVPHTESRVVAKHLESMLAHVQPADPSLSVVVALSQILREYHAGCMGHKAATCVPQSMQALWEEARAYVHALDASSYVWKEHEKVLIERMRAEVQAWVGDIEEVSRLRTSLEEHDHIQLLEEALDTAIGLVQNVKNPLRGEEAVGWYVRMDMLWMYAESIGYPYMGVVRDVGLWGGEICENII